MAKVLSEKKTTKDLILEKAFSFYDRPHYNNFSMSDLAKRAGITKPAIYRHFSSKSELLKEMQDYFFKSLSEHLLEDSDNLHDGVYSCSDLRSAVIFLQKIRSLLIILYVSCAKTATLKKLLLRSLFSGDAEIFHKKILPGLMKPK